MLTILKDLSSGAETYTAGSSGTVFTLGLDASSRRMYVKLNGTRFNTTLNNHWVSGTNNKTIDDDYYIIITAHGLRVVIWISIILI